MFCAFETAVTKERSIDDSIKKRKRPHAFKILAANLIIINLCCPTYYISSVSMSMWPGWSLSCLDLHQCFRFLMLSCWKYKKKSIMIMQIHANPIKDKVSLCIGNSANMKLWHAHQGDLIERPPQITISP